MAKNKIGSIVIVQNRFFSSDLNRTVEVGEKGVVVGLKEPSVFFESYGKTLILLVGGRITSIQETYVKFVNFKFQKSQRNMARSLERKRLKKLYKKNENNQLS